MNTVTRIGITLCFVFGLLANLANAGQPKKSDLEARIANLEEALRKRDSLPVLPVLPPSINGPDCIVGTLAICHRDDGTVVPICAGDIDICWEEDPSPDDCPEVCEAQGNIVVFDHATEPCDNNGSYPFVCMTPNRYAETRSNTNCSGFSVPHYYSTPGGGGDWVCDLSIDTWHISKSMFEALLFESTRTNFLYNEIFNCSSSTEEFDPVTGAN